MALSRSNHTPTSSSSISLTTTSNSLLVIIGRLVTDAGAAPLSMAPTATGLSFTQIVTAFGANVDYSTRISAYYAPVTTGASVTVNLNPSGGSVGQARVEAFTYTGHDTSTPVGATASIQQNASFPSDGALSITLSGAPASTSEVLAGLLYVLGGGAPNVDPGSGWSELYDAPVTDWIATETEARSGSTSTSVAWADILVGTGSTYGNDQRGVAIAFEIKEGTAGGNTTTKTMTDTVTVADAALDPTYRVRQMSDSVVVTDQNVLWRRLKRVADDTLALVDSVVKNVVLAGATTYTKVMSDTLAATDAVVSWLRRVRDGIDSLTMSDGDTYRTAIITGSDAIDANDGFVSWRRSVRVAQDSLDIIDGFSKTLSGAGIVYAKVMSDTVTLIDDAGRRWRLRFSQLTDAVGLSDQVLDSLRAVRSLGDSVELSDGTVKVRRTVRSIDESIEVSDEKISTLYLDQISNTSFTFGSSGPPFRFGGM